jgi:hypothetical protein
MIAKLPIKIEINFEIRKFCGDFDKISQCNYSAYKKVINFITD